MAMPGTYLNSLYELRPLPYAEAGYGYPESGQTVINVTNGKIIRLLVDDESFDVRYGTVHEHERVLDLRAGTLTRRVVWSSPAGVRLQIVSTRLVSFTHRAVIAIEYRVEPLDAGFRAVVQSELVANEALPQAPDGDPRAAAALESPLVSEESQAFDNAAVMVHRTRRSGLRVAAAMDHLIEGPEGTHVESGAFPDIEPDHDRRNPSARPVAAYRQARRLRMVGQPVALRPFTTRWSPRSPAARITGWDGLLDEQRAFLDEFWSGADVEAEGDPEVQQAVRFGLFHVLQAGARAEQQAHPGQGPDRSGLRRPHLLGHRDVRAARAHLHPSAAPRPMPCAGGSRSCPRPRSTPRASASAAPPSRGAPSRARSARATGRPGTAAFHVNADIADAVIRYVDATGDEEFEVATGLPLLVEHGAPVAKPGPPRRWTGGSGSTVSPGRTSTAR